MKPITYKDNVSELVSISVKEAMQMLIDNQDRIGVSMGNLPDRKGAVSREQMADDVAASMNVSEPDPVKVLDCEGGQFDLVGVIVKPWVYFIVDDGVCVHYIKSIHRRENYIIGYNGEKLPPLPEGYGLMPREKAIHNGSFGGIICHFDDGGWSDDNNWLIPNKLGLAFACKLNSDKWRALFPPKTEYKPGDIVVVTKGDGDFYKLGDLARLIHLDHTGCWYADFTINKYFYKWGKWCIAQDSFTKIEPSLQLEVGKWYERVDGIVFEVMRKSKNLCFCSDEEYRKHDGSCTECESHAIRAIDPELSVSLSNLDHETANKVWRAKK